MVDVVGSVDRHRERRRSWQQHWLGEDPLVPTEAAKLFAHVAYDIRNNLFHGHKIYDDSGDREVLEHLWPVIGDVLSRIERPLLTSRLP